MEPAIRKIVDTYVRFGKRRALDDPRAHRVQLIADLKKLAGYDTSKPIAQVEDEIAVIDAGLAKLNRQLLPDWRWASTRSETAPALAAGWSPKFG